MMELTGQRVVLVGGTSGIGLATARAFLDAEARVVIASRSSDKLLRARETLPGDVSTFSMDFRQEDQVGEFFATVGRFDHLVVTAGDGALGPFQDLPVGEARAAFESKFWGQYVTVRAALPYVHEGSSITLTSGVYGVRPPRGASTLAAINSAVEGLVRGLAMDLAPIRVNAVSPGIVDTPIYGGMPGEQREALFHHLAEQLPVGHVATPEEIAQSYVYLAQNRFTTGSVVQIDGGAHLV